MQGLLNSYSLTVMLVVLVIGVLVMSGEEARQRYARGAGQAAKWAGKALGAGLSETGKGIKASAIAIGTGVKAAAIGIGKGIKASAIAIGQGVKASALAVGRGMASIGRSVGKGLKWCFEGVRPLRGAAFVFSIGIGVALTYINGHGAWLRTEDVGYTALIVCIEGLLLVALPIIFAIRGWFNIPVGIVMFCSSIWIASINAKPAIEHILMRGEATVDVDETIREAEALEDEVHGFRHPETDVRDETTGLIFKAKRQEDDASKNRTELGHTTASTAVDESAQAVRDQISAKLKQAAELRASAAQSRNAGQVAITTYVVGEMLRSGSLKVFVGFNPSGTGMMAGARGKRRRRRGILKSAIVGLRNWLWVPDSQEDAVNSDTPDPPGTSPGKPDGSGKAPDNPNPRNDWTPKQWAGLHGADAVKFFARMTRDQKWPLSSNPVSDQEGAS